MARASFTRSSFPRPRATWGDAYPVRKNAFHYTDNANSPYNIGGITRAGEAWRLFVKAGAPGRDVKSFTRTGDLAAQDFYPTYDPVTRRYSVYAVNDTAGTATLTLNTAAWGVPAGNRVLIEEVSASSYGGTRALGSVGADALVSDGTTTALALPANTVCLITVPSIAQAAELIVPATEDARVKDGGNKNTNYGGNTVITAKAGATSSSGRNAGFIKFQLPALHRPDIEAVLLSVHAETISGAGTAQAHVLGIEDTSWTQGAITWANAPNLKQNVPAGNAIAQLSVSGLGTSAQMLGQLVVTSGTASEKLVDVTAFIRSRPGTAASFLISQDPRWDVALPALTAGDTQPDGIDIISTEGGTAGTPGPRLRIIMRKDTDGDGLSDFLETTVYGSDPALPDTDGDGLGDTMESLTTGTNPARADTDGDGFNDFAELNLAGTNPLDPASVLKATATRPTPTSVKLSWNSVSGKTYRVQRVAGLGETWTVVHTTTGTGGTRTFTDSAPPAPSAFYRVEVQ